MNTNPNLIEFSATAFRSKDDNTLDSITASIGFPADKENDVIAQTLDDEDLVTYVIGALHDLAALHAAQLAGQRRFQPDSRCQPGRRKVSVSWRPGHYDRKGLHLRRGRLNHTNEESCLQEAGEAPFSVAWPRYAVDTICDHHILIDTEQR